MEITFQDVIDESLCNLQKRIKRALLKSNDQEFDYLILNAIGVTHSGTINCGGFDNFYFQWKKHKNEKIKTSEIEIEHEIHSEYHDYFHSSYWANDISYSYSFYEITKKITKKMVIQEAKAICVRKKLKYLHEFILKCERSWKNSLNEVILEIK